MASAITTTAWAFTAPTAWKWISLNQRGYASCYELDCDGLDILDLNGPEFSILHWLAVLLENREFDVFSGLALEAKEHILTYFAVNDQDYDLLVSQPFSIKKIPMEMRLGAVA